MCPSCYSTRTVGRGDLATCANPACAKFITAQETPAEAVARRLREEMTPEQRATEQAIRTRCFAIPRLLDMERDL